MEDLTEKLKNILSAIPIKEFNKTVNPVVRDNAYKKIVAVSAAMDDMGGSMRGYKPSIDITQVLGAMLSAYELATGIPPLTEQEQIKLHDEVREEAKQYYIERLETKKEK